MNQQNEKNCQCSKSSCGCRHIVTERCSCGETCACQAECRCGDDCGCAAAK